MKLVCVSFLCSLCFYLAACNALGVPDLSDPATLVAWATDVMATFRTMDRELMNTKSELSDAKVDLQATKADLRETQRHLEETLVEHLKQDKMSVTRQLTNPEARDHGHCILGSRYGYQELVDTEAVGPSIPLDVPEGAGAYECLYQCVLVHDCVAVKISTDAQQCSGLSRIDYTQPNVGWMSYNMTHPDDCTITKQPPIMFQATITVDTLYGASEVIVWDEIRANTTSDLGADGKFRCPVTGTYSFGLDAVPASANSTARVVLKMMHETDIVKYLYAYHSSDTDFIPASCTALLTCGAGEKVWVEAAAALNYLEGYAWQTSFSGQLVTLKN